MSDMNITGKILKRDDDKFLVFGWASVASDKDGKVIVDSQGDTIPIAELEKAAYNFVLHDGIVAAMHRRYGVAHLVESMVFTPDKLETLGLAKDALPQGWFVGFKVTDAETWQKLKNGDYKSFSIGGRATREAATNE